MKTLSEIKKRKLIRLLTWYSVFNRVHRNGLWRYLVPPLILLGIYLNLMYIVREGDAVLLSAACLYLAELPLIFALTRKAARTSIAKRKVNYFDKMFLQFKLDETKFDYTINDDATYYEFVMVEVICDLMLAKLL